MTKTNYDYKKLFNPNPATHGLSTASFQQWLHHHGACGTGQMRIERAGWSEWEAVCNLSNIKDLAWYCSTRLVGQKDRALFRAGKLLWTYGIHPTLMSARVRILKQTPLDMERVPTVMPIISPFEYTPSPEDIDKEPLDRLYHQLSGIMIAADVLSNELVHCYAKTSRTLIQLYRALYNHSAHGNIRFQRLVRAYGELEARMGEDDKTSARLHAHRLSAMIAYYVVNYDEECSRYTKGG